MTTDNELYQSYREALQDRAKETGLLEGHMERAWPYSEYLKGVRKELGPEAVGDAVIVQALVHEARMDLDRAQDAHMRALVNDLLLDVEYRLEQVDELLDLAGVPEGDARTRLVSAIGSRMKHLAERAFSQGMYFKDTPSRYGVTLDNSSRMDWRETNGQQGDSQASR